MFIVFCDLRFFTFNTYYKEVAMSDLRLPSINRVVITGRLTHDTELKHTSGGTPVLKMGIASNRSYKDNQGEWQQEVSFLSVVVWSKLAENCNQYLSKGNSVYVEGRLKSQQWEDSNGNKRTNLEVQADSVQFLDKVSKDGEEESQEKEEEDLPF